MSAPEVQHKILNATFKGSQNDDEGVPVHKFLGIKYASVPARFERAVSVDNFSGATVDATKYGYVQVLNSERFGSLTL
jgi:carboxylesterase type B